MKKFKVGIQLYSVRDHMEKDMDATLKAISEMGYECVEFAGYFDHTAEDVKAMLDKYGLEAVSVHQSIDLFLKEGDEAAKYIKTLGVKYCAIPWINVDNFKDEALYQQFLKNIKEVSALLKKYDIQLCYHNHDFEFGKKDGVYYLDRLYSDTTPDELMTEIDTCWVHYAGENPSKYLEKYAGRAEIVHLKDFECKNLAAGPVYALIDEDGKEMKDDKEEKGFEFRPVGSGRQDVKAILESAEKAGADYVIVEQDGHPDNDSLVDAKISIDYLKTLGQ